MAGTHIARLTRRIGIGAVGLTLLLGAGASTASAQECYLGEVRLFAFNFAPRGWMPAEGQLPEIVQNTALFSLLGTTYGGDGQTTFALPDLRGRAPIGTGEGPGLSVRPIGQRGGSEQATLSTAQMPSHTHQANGTTEFGSSSEPGNGLWAKSSTAAGEYAQSSSLTPMAATALGSTGGSQPHGNMPPFLAMTYAICASGIFPSEN